MDPLIEAIDQAFQRLLVNAGLGGTVPAVGAGESQPTLSEQVKAAQAAAAWAEQRSKIVPSDVKPTAGKTKARSFADVRGKFDGQAGGGRRTAAEADGEA